MHCFENASLSTKKKRYDEFPFDLIFLLSFLGNLLYPQLIKVAIIHWFCYRVLHEDVYLLCIKSIECKSCMDERDEFGYMRKKNKRCKE